MTDFIQPHPEPSNRFASDRTLHHTLERLLPAEVFADASPLFQRMGERAMQEIPALAATAEHNVPRHEPFDAWGRRVDRIEVDPAWHRLVDIGLEEGLVALPYENPYGEFTRVVQAGLVNLYDGAGAVASCPLVMTDGAARLLTLTQPEHAALENPMAPPLAVLLPPSAALAAHPIAAECGFTDNAPISSSFATASADAFTFFPSVSFTTSPSSSAAASALTIPGFFARYPQLPPLFISLLHQALCLANPALAGTLALRTQVSAAETTAFDALRSARNIDGSDLSGGTLQIGRASCRERV